jgi:hypothetical protein
MAEEIEFWTVTKQEDTRIEFETSVNRYVEELAGKLCSEKELVRRIEEASGELGDVGAALVRLARAVAKEIAAKDCRPMLTNWVILHGGEAACPSDFCSWTLQGGILRCSCDVEQWPPPDIDSVLEYAYDADMDPQRGLENLLERRLVAVLLNSAKRIEEKLRPQRPRISSRARSRV